MACFSGALPEMLSRVSARFSSGAAGASLEAAGALYPLVSLGWDPGNGTWDAGTDAGVDSAPDAGFGASPGGGVEPPTDTGFVASTDTGFVASVVSADAEVDSSVVDTPESGVDPAADAGADAGIKVVLPEKEMACRRRGSGVAEACSPMG